MNKFVLKIVKLVFKRLKLEFKRLKLVFLARTWKDSAQKACIGTLLHVVKNVQRPAMKKVMSR